MKKFLAALACCALFEHSFAMHLLEKLAMNDQQAENFTEEARYWERMDTYNKLCGRNRKGAITIDKIIHYHGKDRLYKEWQAKQREKLKQFVIEISWQTAEDTLNAFPEYLETECELKSLQNDFDEKRKQLRSYQSFDWRKAQSLIEWISKNFPADASIANELIQLANTLDDNRYQWVETLLESLDPVFGNLDNWNGRKESVLSNSPHCSRRSLCDVYDGITTQQLIENSPAALEVFHAEFLKLRELNIPILLDFLKKISNFWTGSIFQHIIDEFLQFCYKYFLYEDFALDPCIIHGFSEDKGLTNEDVDLFEECANLKKKNEQLSDKLFFLRDRYFPEEKCERAQRQIQDLMNQEVESASRPLTAEESRNFAPLMSLAHRHDINECRVIDAETLINSYIIFPPEKERLLNLLKHGTPEEVNTEIDKFTEESTFDDRGVDEAFQKVLQSESIMNFLRNCVRNGIPSANVLKSIVSGALKLNCARSRIYRDQTIALIAWSRSFPSFREICEYSRESRLSRLNLNTDRRPVVFSCEEKGGSGADYNEINWSFSQIFSEYGFEFQNGGEDVFTHKYELSSILPHEIGHVIWGELALGKDGDASKAMLFASQAIEVKIDNEIMERNWEKLQALNEETISKEFPLSLATSGHTNMGSLAKDELLKLLQALLDSPALRYHAFFMHDIHELAQIYGLFTKGNTLYFNQLSDFMASLLLGLYVRVDHRALEYNPWIELGMRSPFVIKKLNFDFWNAMKKAAGF